MSSMYCVYHVPENIMKIASRVRSLAEGAKAALTASGFSTNTCEIFNTYSLKASAAELAKITA